MKASQELCYFSVNKRGQSAKFYITDDTTLSGAWTEAVNYWGQVFEIRATDIAKKLKCPPSPNQFKALRKQLNDHEGCDYPASILHHVFSEQRALIDKKKARKSTKEELDDELLMMYTNLEREVAQYFK